MRYNFSCSRPQVARDYYALLFTYIHYWCLHFPYILFPMYTIRSVVILYVWSSRYLLYGCIVARLLQPCTRFPTYTRSILFFFPAVRFAKKEWRYSLYITAGAPLIHLLSIAFSLARRYLYRHFYSCMNTLSAIFKRQQLFFSRRPLKETVRDIWGQ